MGDVAEFLRESCALAADAQIPISKTTEVDWLHSESDSKCTLNVKHQSLHGFPWNHSYTLNIENTSPYILLLTFYVDPLQRAK
jgi:hypothetical protein